MASRVFFRALISLAGAAAAIGFGAANAAAVTFGTVTAEIDAYADRVALVSGKSELIVVDGLAGGNANRSVGREGPNLDVVKCRDSIGCSFDVFFNGGVENQAGADIVLFGLGTIKGVPELFDIIVNGVIMADAQLVDTGLIVGTEYRPQGYNMRELHLDLDLFGVLLGESIESIRIAVRQGINAEDFAGFASLNREIQTLRVAEAQALVNPLPAGFLLFAPGLLAIARFSRKKSA